MSSRQYKIFYFTASYPWGLGETWKTNELTIIKDYFREIVVVPYSYDGNFNHPKKLPEGIESVSPLFGNEQIALRITSIFNLADRNFAYYFREFFTEKVYLSKRKLSSWLIASIKIKQLLQKPLIADIMRHPDKNTILCFFWGKGGCDFLPFIDRHKFKNVVVRFHRYDLIEEENDNYIPYRKRLMASLGIAAPSSMNGVHYLQHKYPAFADRIKLVRLGVRDFGTVQMSSDNVFRILSCSYVIPVKRVKLIAESLKLLGFPVEWTHVGDGPLMKEVKEIISSFPEHVKAVLPGMVDANELMDFYKSREIDVFMNVSTSEGVPMSILECLSLGIPVFATDIGGNGEAVDDKVGCLLPADPSPKLIAEKLTAFYSLSAKGKQDIREAARRKFETMANVEKLSLEFVELITGEQPA